MIHQVVALFLGTVLTVVAGGSRVGGRELGRRYARGVQAAGRTRLLLLDLRSDHNVVAGVGHHRLVVLLQRGSGCLQQVVAVVAIAPSAAAASGASWIGR